MKKGINVLSLFDGMSCGQLALNKAGVKINKYFSSEIDKYSIKVTNKNFPNTINLGTVEFVTKQMINTKIDLLIGGSPCQGFSFAGKQLNFEDPRSKLFFEFVRLKKELKPKYFLLENVKMSKKSQDIISKYLGVYPIIINSRLVSAQNRVRYYWTNIPLKEEIKDKKINFNNISIDGSKYIAGRRGRYLKNVIRQDAKGLTAGKTKQYIEIREDQKSNCLTTVQKDNIVILEDNFFIGPGPKKFKRLEFNNLSKSKTRKLNIVEAERLQNLPDNYTNCVSENQRFKMIGNGWTIDVISHIFKNIN